MKIHLMSNQLINYFNIFEYCLKNINNKFKPFRENQLHLVNCRMNKIIRRSYINMNKLLKKFNIYSFWFKKNLLKTRLDCSREKDEGSRGLINI